MNVPATPGLVTPSPRAPDAVVAVVEFIRSLPYARPTERTSACMIAERRGTCSTKHGFLYEFLTAYFPRLEPELIHRVYRVRRESAHELFGPEVAGAVPAEGLVDVHRYLQIRLAGRIVHIDATFPGRPWDGVTSLPLACGPGDDHPVRGEADAEKRDLEARHCDPAVREPFIAALARAATS